MLCLECFNWYDYNLYKWPVVYVTDHSQMDY